MQIKHEMYFSYHNLVSDIVIDIDRYGDWEVIYAENEFGITADDINATMTRSEVREIQGVVDSVEIIEEF